MKRSLNNYKHQRTIFLSVKKCGDHDNVLLAMLKFISVKGRYQCESVAWNRLLN